MVYLSSLKIQLQITTGFLAQAVSTGMSIAGSSRMVRQGSNPTPDT